MEERELKNLVWQRKFGFLLARGKFKKKKAKFPKVKLQLKIVRTARPFYREFFGEFNYLRTEIVLGKSSFKKTEPIKEVTLKPFKFLSPYGWIFKIEEEEKYFCVRVHGKMIRLMEFNRQRILNDYLKGKALPKKVEFLKETEVRFRRIFLVSLHRRKKLEMYFPSSYDGEKVKIKFVGRGKKLRIEAFKGGKKIKEKIIERT